MSAPRSTLAVHNKHQSAPRHYHLKRNDRGGVLVTKEQIQNLFNFIGKSESFQGGNNVETLTLQQVQDNLSVFFPSMTSKDFKGFEI